MATKTKEKQTEKKQIQAVVQWKGELITISFDDVKTLICPLATEQEAIIFLKTCQSLNLNPFAEECYLIKYSEKEKASLVISIEAYLKASELNPNYNGHEAGIILQDSTGKLELREGSFLTEGEKNKLVGGWARVYRKDKDHLFYMAVNKKECLRYRRDGTLTEFWSEEKQPMMLRKTALKRALVEAFPTLFAGTLATAEVSDAIQDAEYRAMSEDSLPPVLEKDGKPDWQKFYAKIQSDLGLTADQAHELAGMTSFRESLSKGWTMEGIWDLLIAALREKAATPEIKEIPIKEVLFGKEEEKVSAEPTKPPAPAKPKRDPESIKTISELLRACFEDFKMQPQDVYKELGYSSAQDISKKPAGCYREIAAVRE